MKKYLLKPSIVVIVIIITLPFILKPTSSKASVPTSCASADLDWICLDDMESTCKYPGYDDEGAIKCHGELYIHIY